MLLRFFLLVCRLENCCCQCPVYIFVAYNELQTELDFRQCVKMVIHSRWCFEVKVLPVKHLYSMSEIGKKKKNQDKLLKKMLWFALMLNKWWSQLLVLDQVVSWMSFLKACIFLRLMPWIQLLLLKNKVRLLHNTFQRKELTWESFCEVH